MSLLLPDFHSAPYSTRVEDEIMELLWEDGRLVVQSQRPARTRAAITVDGGEFREGGRRQHHRLFIQEDEMASWLQYPFDGRNLGGDDPDSPAPCVTSISDADRDFGTSDSGEVTSENGASEGSRLVPKAAMGELSPSVSGGGRGQAARQSRDETMVTPPPVWSTPTGMGRLAPAGAASQLGMQREKRKREGREAGDGDWLSDEKNARFESANAKEGVAESTPAKRSRRANVPNPSERRRRDRVSRKMKALQELIPQRAKADRGSLLDEVIEYLKSLQLQVQMISMGCYMVPVAFPGVQACMPCMNMGTATDAATNRPVMLFPNISASSMMQPSTNGAHLGPGVPITTFRMQQEAPNQYKTPSPNHLDPTLSSQMIQNPSWQFPANAAPFSSSSWAFSICNNHHNRTK